MNRKSLLTAVLVFIWGLFSVNMILAQTSETTTKESSTTKKTVSKATPAQPASPASQKKTIGTVQKNEPAKPGTSTAKPGISTAKPGATPAKPAVPASAKNSPAAANKPVASEKDLTGYWLTAQKGTIVQFYKNGDVYDGKIVWSKTIKDKSGKELKDIHNPDKAKRNTPVIGSSMITGLKYNPKTDTYEGGKIYQYQSGKSYNCKVNLDKSKNVMKIVGGVGFISKTLTWTRTSGIPGK